METLWGRLEQLHNGVERFVTVVASSCLVVMTLAMTVSALTRHLLDKPIGGVYEITVYYLMPGLVWLGMSATERNQSHVRVQYFVGKLPDRVRARLYVGTRLLVAAVMVVILVSSLRGLEARWGATLGGAISLPVGPSRLLVPIGVALLALRLVFRPRRAREKEPDPSTGTA